MSTGGTPTIHAVPISTVIILYNFIEQCTTEAHHLTFKKFHGETQTVAV
jgi:hypothetical protein